MSIDRAGEVKRVSTGVPGRRSRGVAGAAKLGTDAGQQLRARERLDHEVVGAEVEGADLVGRAGADGEDEHRRVAGGADALDHVEAVGARHGQVGENEVRPQRAETLHRLDTVDRRDDVESICPQMLRERGTDALIVVDDENPPVHADTSSTSGRCAASRSTRATAPPPGRFDSVIWPPLALLRLRAISSPRPLRGVSLGAATTPGPRSATSSRTRSGSSGCRKAASSMALPVGEAWCAFSMRFTRISSASEGST